MNFHSLRTIAFIGIVFVIAGLQALHSVPALTQYSNIIDMAAAVLLTLEHTLYGNSGSGSDTVQG